MSELIHLHQTAMQRRNLAESSITKRMQRLRKFDRHVGLCSATTEQVEAFLDTLHGWDGGPLSPKARYQWISDLHGFYDWAVKWDHLDHDPTARIERPRLKRRLPRPIPTADLAFGLQMAGPVMRVWLTLGAFAGLRVSEIAHMEVHDLLWHDGPHGLLRVTGKGDKERMVPMHPEVRRLLQMTPQPSRGRVFRRPRGGGYPPHQVSREVSVFFDGIGVGATAHQLRHWFGTQVYRACRDLRVVQELLGHESIQTSTIYVDWSRDEAYAAIEALSVDVTPSLLSDWGDVVSAQ